MVIGHRGAMGHETENTLASVQKALDLEVDMMEIDVFKIKSGEIVVFHDSTVDRLTDGHGPVESYTLAELKQLTLIGDHKIPTLSEVLELINKSVPLNIELKGADTAVGVQRIMEKFINRNGWTMEHFIISSFYWEELRKMRQINPEVALAILIEGEDPAKAIPIARELSAEAINPDIDQLDHVSADKIKASGFKIYTWTVNAEEDIQKAKQLAVDGIITNYPERIN
ncbi:glycerophosphodiester phosphodiesterase family protein [Flavobacteriaceae bacterium 3-367]